LYKLHRIGNQLCLQPLISSGDCRQQVTRQDA